MNDNSESNNQPLSEESSGDSDKYIPIGIPVVDGANRAHEELIKKGMNIAKNKEFEELKDPRKSPKDSLTGLYTRECFERFKEYEFDPNKDDNEIMLLFFDLNDLKITNDKKGHEAGDKLIIEAAEWLRSVFDENIDYIMRVGGDEYLVVYRNNGKDEKFGEKKLEQIRQSLLEMPSLSIAYGGTTYQKNIKFMTEANELVEFEDIDLKYTLKQSDNKMYKMKEQIKFDRLNRSQKLFRKIFKKSFAKTEEIR